MFRTWEAESRRRRGGEGKFPAWNLFPPTTRLLREKVEWEVGMERRTYVVTWLHEKGGGRKEGREEKG